MPDQSSSNPSSTTYKLMLSELLNSPSIKWDLYLPSRKKWHNIYNEPGMEKVKFLFSWEQVPGVTFAHRKDKHSNRTVIVCGRNQAKPMKGTQEINEWICQQKTLLFFSPCQAWFSQRYCISLDNSAATPSRYSLSGGQHVYSQNAHFHFEFPIPCCYFLQT